MTNWWDTVKESKLVNLPKFKVKPFNVNKPEEEETRCRDKIMEIVNFTENFNFPDKIAEEFVKVKEERTITWKYLYYYGEASTAKLNVHWEVKKREVDKIPEEVYCKALDMLNSGGGRDIMVMDYKITVNKNKDDQAFFQSISIKHPTYPEGGHVLLMLTIMWDEWFEDTVGEYKDDLYIDEELLKLANEMEWSI